MFFFLAEENISLNFHLSGGTFNRNAKEKTKSLKKQEKRSGERKKGFYQRKGACISVCFMLG